MGYFEVNRGVKSAWKGKIFEFELYFERGKLRLDAEAGNIHFTAKYVR